MAVYSCYCNILQHTAAYCSILQYSATHCTILHHTATHCNILQHTATYCNILQHTATHCTILPHTAAHCSMNENGNLQAIVEEEFNKRMLVNIVKDYAHRYTCYILINRYGVATISRLLKMIGLFCKRALQKRPIFCKRDP